MSCCVFLTIILIVGGGSVNIFCENWLVYISNTYIYIFEKVVGGESLYCLRLKQPNILNWRAMLYRNEKSSGKLMDLPSSCLR